MMLLKQELCIQTQLLQATKKDKEQQNQNKDLEKSSLSYLIFLILKAHMISYSMHYYFLDTNQLNIACNMYIVYELYSRLTVLFNSYLFMFSLLLEENFLLTILHKSQLRVERHFKMLQKPVTCYSEHDTICIIFETQSIIANPFYSFNYPTCLMSLCILI